jgi:resuscitation-promoting factor RpfB
MWLGLGLAGGLMLLTLAALSAAVVFALLPAEYHVTLVVNDQLQPISTRARSVAALLDEQSIRLGAGDTVSPALASRLTQNLTIQVRQARSVTLTIDGQTQVYRTHLTNPGAILESAGLIPGPKDEVIVDGTLTTPAQLANWPVPVSRISVRRTMPVTVVDDTNTQIIETTSQTVGEALFDAGVTLFLADQVVPDLDAPVTANLRILIERARPLYINADGTTVSTRVRGSTVADALAAAELTLVGQDYTIPDEDTALLPGMRIRVIRVKEEWESTDNTVPFETVFQADSSLELDQTQVVQTGQQGLERTTTLVRYENGIEVSRAPGETEVIQEARNQVIAYGTNIVLRTVDTPDGPRQYWRRMRMYATSYHPAALGGDNITATGQVLRKGIVASDPDLITYDSEVFVPGYGIGRMADTGPAYRPRWIDLGYDDANWVSWSRWVDVYLLAPVPERIQYFLPPLP